MNVFDKESSSYIGKPQIGIDKGMEILIVLISNVIDDHYRLGEFLSQYSNSFSIICPTSYWKVSKEIRTQEK